MKYVVNLNGINYAVEVNACEGVVTNVATSPAAVAAPVVLPSFPLCPPVLLQMRLENRIGIPT